MWNVRRAIIRALHRRGIHRIGADPFGAIDKELLFKRYAIDLVIDVGANVGAYARYLRSLGYTGRIISLEPASAPFAVLQASAAGDPLWDVYKLAAGEVDGEAEFNVNNASDTNSFFSRTHRFDEEHPSNVFEGREMVQVSRLDRFADQVADGSNVWVKLDLEGFEKNAIAGGKQLITRARVLEVELATERLLENEPLFFEVAPRNL